MIQLRHLARLGERLPIVGTLARRALGIEPETLRRRVQRGSPELSSREAEAIRDYLAGVGVTVETEADQ